MQPKAFNNLRLLWFCAHLFYNNPWKLGSYNAAVKHFSCEISPNSEGHNLFHRLIVSNSHSLLAGDKAPGVGGVEDVEHVGLFVARHLANSRAAGSFRRRAPTPAPRGSGNVGHFGKCGGWRAAKSLAAGPFRTGTNTRAPLA